MNRPFAGLLADGAVRRYWAAHSTFVLGNTLTGVVVPLIVLAETGSASLTATAASLGFLPFIAFGLVAGALVDHLDVRRIMTAAALVAAATMLVAVGVAGDSGALVPVVLAVRIVVGIAEVWYTMGHFVTLPSLVARDELAEAAALLQSTQIVLALFAPLATVVLLDRFGHRPVVLIVGIVFLASAVLRRAVPSVVGGQPSIGVRSAVRAIPEGVAQGFRATFGDRFLRVVTGTGFLSSLAYGAVTALVAVYLLVEFQVGASDPIQGVFLTAGSIGVVAQMWLLPVIRRRCAPIASIALLHVLVMVGTLVLAVSPTLPVALIAFGALTGWGTLMFTNLISLRMEVVPPGLQGRVGSVSRMFAAGGIPIGGILGGLAVEHVGVRGLFASTAIVWIASLAVLWRERGLRAPDPDDLEARATRRRVPAAVQPGSVPLATGRSLASLQADHEPG